jgi:hypothetical protein
VILYTIFGFVVWLILKLINSFSENRQMFFEIIKYSGIILGIIIILYFIGNKIRNGLNKEAKKLPKPKLNKKQRRLKKLGINPALLEKDGIF